MTDTNWRERAACQGSDPELWFPDNGGRGGDEARRICQRCPVADDCLEYAVVTGQRDGIWGGKGEKGIRDLRVQRGLSFPVGRPPAARKSGAVA